MPRARANALLLVICNVPDIRVSSCKMVCQFVTKANEMVHGRGTVDVNRRYHQLRPGSTPRRVVSVMAIFQQLTVPDILAPSEQSEPNVSHHQVTCASQNGGVPGWCASDSDYRPRSDRV